MSGRKTALRMVFPLRLIFLWPPPADFLNDIMTADTSLNASAAHSRRVMTSSRDMTWATPQAWFDYLDLEFDFTLDPCCTHETAKCPRHFTPAENGLVQSWEEETVFMNPPYGRDVGI